MGSTSTHRRQSQQRRRRPAGVLPVNLRRNADAICVLAKAQPRLVKQLIAGAHQNLVKTFSECASNILRGNLPKGRTRRGSSPAKPTPYGPWIDARQATSPRRSFWWKADLRVLWPVCSPHCSLTLSPNWLVPWRVVSLAAGAAAVSRRGAWRKKKRKGKRKEKKPAFANGRWRPRTCYRPCWPVNTAKTATNTTTTSTMIVHQQQIRRLEPGHRVSSRRAWGQLQHLEEDPNGPAPWPQCPAPRGRAYRGHGGPEHLLKTSLGTWTDFSLEHVPDARGARRDLETSRGKQSTLEGSTLNGCRSCWRWPKRPDDRTAGDGSLDAGPEYTFMTDLKRLMAKRKQKAITAVVLESGAGSGSWEEKKKKKN